MGVRLEERPTQHKEGSTHPRVIFSRSASAPTFVTGRIEFGDLSALLCQGQHQLHAVRAGGPAIGWSQNSKDQVSGSDCNGVSSPDGEVGGLVRQIYLAEAFPGVQRALERLGTESLWNVQVENGFTDAELRAIYGKLDKNRNGPEAEEGGFGRIQIRGISKTLVTNR